MSYYLIALLPKTKPTTSKVSSALIVSLHYLIALSCSQKTIAIAEKNAHHSHSQHTPDEDNPTAEQILSISRNKALFAISWQSISQPSSNSAAITYSRFLSFGTQKKRTT